MTTIAIVPVLAGLGMLAKAAIPAVGGFIANKIFGGDQDRRQLEQQRKLQEQQIAGAKEMGEFNQKQQLAMMRQQYGENVAGMKEAGLSTGLMYGGGGAGGATAGQATMPTGGTADGAGVGVQNTMQLAMMQAQMENIKADTEVKKATAGKTAGVDTASAEADVKAKEFQNTINKFVGEENFAQALNWANQKLSYESQKTMAEYNAWQAANFEGQPTDSQNSPLAKAISAGLQESLIKLKEAKANANAAEAEAIIKRFTANLTKQGIAEGTPWYVKFTTDLLNKAGINISNTAADTLKQ